MASDSQLETLVRLFRRGTKVFYRKGDFIIRPGSPPAGVFYIQSGLVKAYDITKYGEENLLIVRKEQEIFPLIWAITGQERQVIYQAMNGVVAWRLSREEFMDHLEHTPDTLPPLLDMCVEMYRMHSERIINLEYRSVRERLISFLLTMSQRFGKLVEDGVLIDLPLRHQDIASSINASRETTGRELTRLQAKGLVRNTPNTILLTNVEALGDMLANNSQR